MPAVLERPEAKVRADTRIEIAGRRRPVAVITGTSRDVGMYTALEFARTGWDILGGYKNPQHDNDQAEIVRQVESLGGRMRTVRGDIRDPQTAIAFSRALDENFDGKLEALVLNAAGGYKASVLDAVDINVNAQFQLVDQLKPKFSDEGVIVYDQSVPGHLITSNNIAQVPEDYLPVAVSKREAESKLRESYPEDNPDNIRLAVVVGNALEGTFVTRVLKRRNQDLVNKWLEVADSNHFPSAEDMARAVVKVATFPYPSEHTEYVGLAAEHRKYLTGKAIEEIIPHRDGFMLLGRVIDLERGQSARAEFIRDPDHPMLQLIKKGHFPGFPLVPGMILGEGLNQTAAVALFSDPSNKELAGLLTGLNNFRFRSPVRPGEVVSLQVELTKLRLSEGGGLGIGHGQAFVGKNLAVEGDITAGIKPRSGLGL